MLRLGIVGAGIMGTNHSRLAAALPSVAVATIVDPDLARAERLAGSVGATATDDVRSILDTVDVAVVAAPNDLHGPLAIDLLKAGVHVLVEKPLAPTVAEAEEIVAAAEASGALLGVGHVERFNPAVLELDQILGEVLHLSAARISPYSSRIRDGVIADLMIHDLDIALSIAQSPVDGVECLARVVRSEREDIASALVHFESGVTATLTASRIGQQKIRELQITQPDSFVTVDLLRQDVTINRVEHSEFLSDEGARYRQSGVVEIPFLEHRGEPLFLELKDFVGAVTDGGQPRVSGPEGVEAIRLVSMVEQAARRS